MKGVCAVLAVCLVLAATLISTLGSGLRGVRNELKECKQQLATTTEKYEEAQAVIRDQDEAIGELIEESMLSPENFYAQIVEDFEAAGTAEEYSAVLSDVYDYFRRYPEREEVQALKLVEADCYKQMEESD